LGVERVVLVTIHVLEDDAAVNDSLVVWLKNMGHEAVAYRTPEQFFQQGPPPAGDIVIVDLLLPRIPGVAVVKWLQRLKTPPRVIAITGQPQSALEATLRDVRIPVLLRKPLTGEAIAACLAQSKV
jgi:FixJ family two-component response regulator